MATSLDEPYGLLEEAPLTRRPIELHESELDLRVTSDALVPRRIEVFAGPLGRTDRDLGEAGSEVTVGLWRR